MNSVQSKQTIYHVLMIKFPPAKEHRMEQFMADLEALRAKISGFLTLSGGRNCSEEGLTGGFTHAAVMTFSDAATLDYYMTHPDHIAIKDAYVPDFESLLVLDYLV